MADYKSFDLVDTPDPNEVAVMATVAVDQLKGAQLPVAGVTTYGAFQKAARVMGDNAFAAYVYTGMTKPGVGYLTFYFAKPKTVAEMAVPFRRYTKKFGNHYWHPILVDLVIVTDRSRVIAQPGPDGTTRYEYPHVVRQLKIPPISEGTRFVVEEYLGPRPFVLPRSRVPQPGSVSYDFGDVNGSVEECLHARLELGSQQTVFAIDSAARVSSPGYGAIEGQVFPATNFTTRRRYTLSQDQEQLPQNAGPWFAWKIRVKPPRGSEELVIQ